MTELSQDDKELTIEITNKCPNTCIHCSSEGSPEKDTFLSLDFIYKELINYQDFNIVRISGGEPFEHPDLVDIVQLLHGAGKQVQLLSCGSKIDSKDDSTKPVPQYLMNAIQPYISEIVFSLHGPQGLHDKIAGSPVPATTLFDTVCRSLEHAREANIPYSFHTVVMQLNFAHLESLAIEIQRLGEYANMSEQTNWHLLRFIKQGRAKDRSDLALTPEQAAVIPYLAKEFSEGYNLDVTYTKSFNAGAPECTCHRKAVILYNGITTACSALKDGTLGKHFACKKKL